LGPFPAPRRLRCSSLVIVVGPRQLRFRRTRRPRHCFQETLRNPGVAAFLTPHPPSPFRFLAFLPETLSWRAAVDHRTILLAPPGFFPLRGSRVLPQNQSLSSSFSSPSLAAFQEIFDPWPSSMDLRIGRSCGRPSPFYPPPLRDRTGASFLSLRRIT